MLTKKSKNKSLEERLIRVNLSADQYQAYKKAVKASGMKSYAFNTLAIKKLMSSLSNGTFVDGVASGSMEGGV